MKQLVILFTLFGASITTMAQLSANMYLDSTHAPFTLGVTSGDPTTDAVILWTRIEPDSATQANAQVNWEIAKDMGFTQVINSGTVTTDANSDWTINVDATGLAPHTIYYYRFDDGNGNYSVMGRTRTAPAGLAPHVRMATLSCSSVFSGFFNGYRRIAEREDLDLIVHVGDYIYDFVDSDEQVRVPVDYPYIEGNGTYDVDSLHEWRELHRLYLHDPDLREARRMHPWILMWDNHDVAGSNKNEPIQAFHEYVPVRVPDSTEMDKIYRTIHYGDLIDFITLDILLFRDTDQVPGTGDNSIIGNDQYNWFTQELSNSTAVWKFVPSQNLIGGWSIIGIPQWIGIGNGTVLDDSNWDGYDSDRDRVLHYLDDNNINNVFFLTGDSHVSIAADLSWDPVDGSVYDPATGNGSVAVELLASSLTRGNLDEMGFGWALGIIEPIMSGANPNHVYQDWTEHGYGIVDVKPDSAVAEMWFSDKMGISNTETFAGGYVVEVNSNHYNRDVTATPTGDKDITWLSTEPIANEDTDDRLRLFPNPTEGILNLELSFDQGDELIILVMDMTGRLVKKQDLLVSNGNQNLQLDLSSLTNGQYILSVEINGNERVVRTFTINH